MLHTRSLPLPVIDSIITLLRSPPALRSCSASAAPNPKHFLPLPLQAVHPLTGTMLPVFCASYVRDLSILCTMFWFFLTCVQVLGDFGSGAVMGVPAHDTRDGVLAEVQRLPVVSVIAKTAGNGGVDNDSDGEGVMVNSGEFDGLRPSDAKKAIGEELKVGRSCGQNGG